MVAVHRPDKKWMTGLDRTAMVSGRETAALAGVWLYGPASLWPCHSAWGRP